MRDLIILIATALLMTLPFVGRTQTLKTNEFEDRKEITQELDEGGFKMTSILYERDGVIIEKYEGQEVVISIAQFKSDPYIEIFVREDLCPEKWLDNCINMKVMKYPFKRHKYFVLTMRPTRSYWYDVITNGAYKVKEKASLNK